MSGGGGSEDYIMKGRSDTPPYHIWHVDQCQSYLTPVLGYSPEVDHLREKLQENEMRASELCSQIMCVTDI